jgi:hypothetical protein
MDLYIYFCSLMPSFSTDSALTLSGCKTQRRPLGVRGGPTFTPPPPRPPATRWPPPRPPRCPRSNFSKPPRALLTHTNPKKETGDEARLGELVLTGLVSPDAPAIFRGGGGGHFTRLTRLEYGPSSYDCVDLGQWSAAEFSIPTLVELTVVACAFTLGGQDGRAWAAAVAREALPRLARLEILLLEGQEMPGFVKYACGAGPQGRRHLRQDRPVCLSCGAEGGCAGGREVERALWEALPAAAADAGRRLLMSDRRRTAKWWSPSNLTHTLHFEAAPPEG